MSGTYYRAFCAGRSPFPALLDLHEDLGTGETYVDIYDTKWITAGRLADPARRPALTTATRTPVQGQGLRGLVKQTGATSRPTSTARSELRRRQSVASDPHRQDRRLVHRGRPERAADPVRAHDEPLALARGDGTELLRRQVADPGRFGLVRADHRARLGLPLHRRRSSPKRSRTPGAEHVQPGLLAVRPVERRQPRTGAGCYQSLGTIVATYQLALQTKNVNSTPDNLQTYISPATPSCSRRSRSSATTATSQVLTGGTADARGSQGNTAEATFAWTFTPGGAATGLNPTVPATAPRRSRSRRPTRADTARPRAAGRAGGPRSELLARAQPGPQGQPPDAEEPDADRRGGDARHSVDLRDHAGRRQRHARCSGASTPSTAGDRHGARERPARTPHPDVALHRGRRAEDGPSRAAVLRDGLQPEPGARSSTPMQTTRSSGRRRSAARSRSVCSRVDTYYLFDDETVPGGSHPGASFWKSSDSAPAPSARATRELTGSPTSGYGPATFVASSTCQFELLLQGRGARFGRRRERDPLHGLGRHPPPTPTPTPPGASLSLAVPSPANPNVGQTVTFTATANFAPNSYSWDFGDSGPPERRRRRRRRRRARRSPGCRPMTFASGGIVAGPNPNTHVYTATGTLHRDVHGDGRRRDPQRHDDGRS